MGVVVAGKTAGCMAICLGQIQVEVPTGDVKVVDRVSVQTTLQQYIQYRTEDSAGRQVSDQSVHLKFVQCKPDQVVKLLIGMTRDNNKLESMNNNS